VVVVEGAVVVVVGSVVVKTTLEVVVTGSVVLVASPPVTVPEHAAKRAQEMRSHHRRMGMTIRPAPS
jgi:hypothetical protein